MSTASRVGTFTSHSDRRRGTAGRTRETENRLRQEARQAELLKRFRARTNNKRGKPNERDLSAGVAMSESVCRDHVPDYARDGRILTPSSAPCCVCEAPSLVVLPNVIEPFVPEGLRSDGEWPK